MEKNCPLKGDFSYSLQPKEIKSEEEERKNQRKAMMV